MKKFIYLTTIALAFLIGCQSPESLGVEPETEPETEPQKEAENTTPPLIPLQAINLTNAEKLVATQNNTFAFNLLQTVYATENTQQNIFISPFSASLALSMLNNGAAGDTQKEIQDVLGYGNISREALNIYSRKMLKAMTELDPRGVFESANSIWIRKDFPVLSDFKTVNKQYYDAEVRNEDFANPATLALINGWVKEKTHDKIPEILKELSTEDVMCLINALYFKGYWSLPFKKEETSNEVFQNLDGTNPTLPTMKMTSESLSYVKKESFGLLELPFGNEAFSLVLVLPDQDKSVASVLTELDTKVWEDCLTALSESSAEIHLQLPRFNIEYERELNDDLKTMGMKSMFENANFSLINSSYPLVVSVVIQKTFAEVNENGMEAAVATVVKVKEISTGEDPVAPPRVDFYVDRPFIFLLKEKSTGSIFFAGIMKNLK